jgi:hypothetical protein
MMDTLFLLAVVALYLLTHWLTAALARLGGAR